MSTENETAQNDEPAELTAADFEPQDDEGQSEAAASESDPQEGAESQAAGEEGEGAEGQAAEAQQEADPYATPPEFWSAEKKAVWDKVTDPDVRAAIHEHERQASTAIAKRLEEISGEEKTRKTALDRMNAEREALAKFLDQNVPVWEQAFGDRWAKVDWVKMADEDPALYAKMTAQRDAEHSALSRAQQARQYESQQATARQKAQFEEFRNTEHQKLARSLPEHFGDGKAQKTYDDLGDWLQKTKGFTPEQINQTAAAPLIEIALKAMLYEKAQAALKANAGKKPAQAQGQQATTATQTSRRIAPAARQTGQATKGDAQRQAEQRLSKTGWLTDERDIEAVFG